MVRSLPCDLSARSRYYCAEDVQTPGWPDSGAPESGYPMSTGPAPWLLPWIIEREGDEMRALRSLQRTRLGIPFEALRVTCGRKFRGNLTFLTQESTAAPVHGFLQQSNIMCIYSYIGSQRKCALNSRRSVCVLCGRL